MNQSTRNKRGINLCSPDYHDNISGSIRQHQMFTAAIPGISGALCLVMCGYSLLFKEYKVLIAGLVGGFLCFAIAVGLKVINRRKSPLMVAFCIIVCVMLVLMLSFGGKGGLLGLWVFLLPAYGPIIIGKKYSILLSAAIFILILILFWTPVGLNFLNYPYTSEFRVLFSIIYGAFYTFGIFIEMICEKIYASTLAVQEQYREMTGRDMLTGAHNRYWMDNELPAAVSRCTGKCFLTLMMIDIDYFKIFNDTYGHLYGDKILKLISSTIAAQLDERGELCRFGGEEFLIFVEGCNFEEAGELAEKIRKAVEDIESRTDEGVLTKATVSIGTVSLIPNQGDQSDPIIAMADKAQYVAKYNGKNCVVQYQDI